MYVIPALPMPHVSIRLRSARDAATASADLYSAALSLSNATSYSPMGHRCDIKQRLSN
jgi:hypothetical protein